MPRRAGEADDGYNCDVAGRANGNKCRRGGEAETDSAINAPAISAIQDRPAAPLRRPPPVCLQFFNLRIIALTPSPVPAPLGIVTWKCIIRLLV